MHAVTEQAVAPVVQFLRMISPLSWAPIAVALFGIGNQPVIFLVAAASVWPIVLNTAAGVRAIDPGLLLVARSFGASRREQLTAVILPAVRAQVQTGLRIGLGIAWVVLVPAEMLGVRSGLGYQILNARDQLAYDQVMAVIVVIGVIGYALDTLSRWCSTAADRCRGSAGRGSSVGESGSGAMDRSPHGGHSFGRRRGDRGRDRGPQAGAEVGGEDGPQRPVGESVLQRFEEHGVRGLQPRHERRGNPAGAAHDFGTHIGQFVRAVRGAVEGIDQRGCGGLYGLPRAGAGIQAVECVECGPDMSFEVMEEDIFFCGKVVEERAARNTGRVRYIGRRGRGETAVEEQVRCRANDGRAGLRTFPVS